MANNFKSKEVHFTTSSTLPLLTCNTTSVIVSSITYQGTASASSATLKFTKSGGTARDVLVEKAPADLTLEFLTKSFVLENGDSFSMSVGGLSGTATVTLHYMERTADVATSTLGDLSNVSSTAASGGQILAYNAATSSWEPQTLSGADLGTASDTGDLPAETVANGGTEPLNRYMKGLNGLDDLTDNSSNLPAHVLYSDPTNVHFVVENNSLTTPVVQKVTWDQLIKSIIEVGVNDLVAAGYGSTATFSPGGILGDLNGDGSVSTADLLEFLTLFGQSWADNAGDFWQPTTADVSNANNTVISNSITTLSFDATDVTVTQGTQAVTVSGAANTITIESGSGNTPMSALSTKKLRLTTTNSSAPFHVVTDQGNELVFYYVLIDCYDDSDVQVGSTVQYFFGTQIFTEAATYTTNTITGANWGDIPAPTFIDAGITDGLANTDVEKIVVKFGAKNNSGNGTIVIINNLEIALVNG